ncbi:hypothetical protein ACJD0Z_13965 [Flavobacteriaceae bacterium M23B6Z8]
MASNAKVLKRDDLKFIAGAGERYDALGGGEPNCVGVPCVTTDDCQDAFCPRCDKDGTDDGLCAT